MAGKLPIVAIIGRQNVGKSTLFNALIRSKKAIVDPYPGLTRDIISCVATAGESSFVLADTPGLDIASSAELSQSIVQKTKEFLHECAAVVLLLENPLPAPFDLDLIELLRKLERPVIVAVNKMDTIEDLANMPHFYEVGFNDIVPISAEKRRNLDLLLDKVTAVIPRRAPAEETPDLRVAIVGRPNSGKSTLLNAFMGYERALVSDIPGTTRDAVDERFRFQGKLIAISDTAGIRRKSRITERVEYFSLDRALGSIRASDIVVHLVDAEQGLTETDKKISDEIMKAMKPVIIAINKWDVIEKDHTTFNAMKDRIHFKFYKAADFPIISVSARDRLRIHKLMETVIDLYERSSLHIETGRLNRTLETVLKKHRPPKVGSTLKVYYATQTGTCPPQLVMFVNRPELFTKDIHRFFEKRLQEELAIPGVPVIIRVQERTGRKAKKPS